jgi:tetratricopeptide (TPR) repeat protein
MLYSCASLRKSSNSSKNSSAQLSHDPLSFEERRKFDYFFLEAVRQKEIGEIDAAFELFNHCLSIYPESAATLYELGKSYMYLGQPEKGERFFRKAMILEPDNYWYKETLAGYYQRKGENAKAIEVVEEMAEQFPSRLEPLMALIDMYDRSQNYDKVVHTLNRLERLDGKSEQISMEKFRTYLAMDSTEQAFTEIKNLIDEFIFLIQVNFFNTHVFCNRLELSIAHRVKFGNIIHRKVEYVKNNLNSIPHNQCLLY